MNNHKVIELNIEYNNPTVSSALQKLKNSLATYKRQGTKAVIVIHGYGSTGVGGSIKTAVRSRSMARRLFLTGYSSCPQVVPILSPTLSGTLSFVAEVNGQVRGFILGQVARVRESATEIGIIQMIGVHPDYQRRGIGSRLVRALSDKYRSQGIKVIRIGVNYRDKSLLGLVEHAGFGVDRLVIYSMIV